MDLEGSDQNVFGLQHTFLCTASAHTAEKDLPACLKSKNKCGMASHICSLRKRKKEKHVDQKSDSLREERREGGRRSKEGSFYTPRVSHLLSA